MVKIEFEKVEVIEEEGIFKGWLRDSERRIHNPKFNEIYIKKF